VSFSIKRRQSSHWLYSALSFRGQLRMGNIESPGLDLAALAEFSLLAIRAIEATRLHDDVAVPDSIDDHEHVYDRAPTPTASVVFKRFLLQPSGDRSSYATLGLSYFSAASPSLHRTGEDAHRIRLIGPAAREIREARYLRVSRVLGQDNWTYFG
jgi:hypothetical protein